MTGQQNITLIKSPRNWVTGIGLVFWLIYLFATIKPEMWWGIHFAAFLPDFFKYGILIFSLGCILYFHFKPLKIDRIAGFLKSNRFVIIVSCLMAISYYSLPMAESVYGDSELFQEKMGESTIKYNSKFLKHLIEFDFTNPKLGNTTVLSGVRLMSYGFGLTHQEVYRIIGMLSGFLFVYLMLSFLNKNIGNNQLKIVLILLVIMAPFSQLFFGYQEVYAPAFPAVAAYLIVLLNYLKSRKGIVLFYLIILLLLCLKFHTVYILLAPSLVLAILYYFKEKSGVILSVFTWKKVMLFVLLPISGFGIFTYFFIFKDYNDPRFLGPEVDIYSRLFLPIISPEAPLDKYSLLSLNHIFDFVNMMFLWSAGGLFLLMIIVLFYRKYISWNKPEVILLGMTLILFVMIYFAYNPLMSMPMDFDLFSLGAPVLLLFVIVLAGQLEKSNLILSVTGTLLALTILTLPIYLVNSDEEALSYRMESVGKHVFKTYWIRSAGDIDVGIKMLGRDKELYLNRYLKAVEELEPFALKGNDHEYAVLLWQTAVFYRKEEKDYKKALFYHKKAQSYNEDMMANYIGLMESSYYLEDFNQAYLYSQNLMSYKYPNEKKALRIAIDCAVQAKLVDKAIDHINNYLLKWEDEDMIRLKMNLENPQD